MANANADVGPLTERFDLMKFTDGLIGDLQRLRNGEISVQDARARAELARQVLRSVALVVTAQKFLADHARDGRPARKSIKGTEDSRGHHG